MKDLLKGDDKIQKICDVIKKETLDPAKQQALKIIENAKIESKSIIKKANIESEKIINDAKKEIEKEKKIFDSALNLAARQGFDDLKQKIEKELFNKNLKDLIIENTKEPKIIANLINIIIKIIEEEGLDVDISAYIPKYTNPKAVNDFLIAHIKDKLREKEVILSDFEGGAKIKLHENEITIDMSNKALKELIANYIRSDFREKIFNV
ncbi:MAG: V-type proton ATPase subunit E [Candidatus Anoxychlamydiales bacterium]|nr:V-type proton ATPase subunit E [Candidatus Anoxychlamydiales bacterium]